MGGREGNGENNKCQGGEKEKTPSSTVIDFGGGILIRIASHRFLDRGTVSPIFRRYTLVAFETISCNKEKRKKEREKTVSLEVFHIVNVI